MTVQIFMNSSYCHYEGDNLKMTELVDLTTTVTSLSARKSIEKKRNWDVLIN